MLDTLTTLGNILLMVAGFGFIIAVHESGHFLAARWAGIRVQAFAVGFGSALVSWRKGLGLRRGSSEAEYLRLTANGTRRIDPADPACVSHTEYRLNWFPFGGYVKMLGQEDANPAAASNATDSFTSKSVPKRMVVISGGVVMNLILAAVLFVIAYSAGIREPLPIVGLVAPGSAAEAAGFRPGDRVLSIDGEKVRTFSDIALATALSAGGRPLTFEVARPSHASPLPLTVLPRKNGEGMLQIGVGPAPAALIPDRFASRAEKRDFQAMLPFVGLAGVEPGMRLASVAGEPIPEAGTEDPLALPLEEAIAQSGGAPIELVFRDDATARDALVQITPRPRLETARTRIGAFSGAFLHLLGLVPAVPILSVEAPAKAAGLLPGDLLARVGSTDWPSIPETMAEIQSRRGGSVEMIVVRGGFGGPRLPLTARVDANGRVGFRFSHPASAPPVLARAPDFFPLGPEDAAPVAPPAARLSPALLAGSRIVGLAGSDEPPGSFADLRAAIQRLIAGPHERNEPATIELEIELPITDAGSSPSRERIALSLTSEEVHALYGRAWEADDLLAAFAVAQFTDIARNPIDAVAKGVRKTHQIITSTYLTFLRLFQRTVPADQLRGPVGITHIGARVASQGMVYLVFFLGLISANLAVINFLPLPLVDGGLMLFLIIEALTKRPVSIAVQNIATLIGLALIGAVFLFVTFNDLFRLFS